MSNIVQNALMKTAFLCETARWCWQRTSARTRSRQDSCFLLWTEKADKPVSLLFSFTVGSVNSNSSFESQRAMSVINGALLRSTASAQMDKKSTFACRESEENWSVWKGVSRKPFLFFSLFFFLNFLAAAACRAQLGSVLEFNTTEWTEL